MTHDDVRMRGFHHRLPFDEAVARVVATVAALAAGPDTVALADGLDRLLLTDAVAPRPVPAFDRAAMDGYAVAAELTFPATDYEPVPLELLGESLPGRPFPDVVTAGRAVRIMTGAPLPEGADAVVPAELAREERGFVMVERPVAPGRHVSRTGEDLFAGAVAVPAGRRLRPQDLAVIAALGMATVTVAPRPRVRALVTGDELCRPGETLGAYQVFDANSTLIHAAAGRWGAAAHPPVLLPDDPARLRRALRDMAGDDTVDLVLVTGGTSVGQEDHAPALLDELGELLFHGVALRPAAPVGFGRVDGTPVFLMPGNPVSCLCAFDLLVGPALRTQQGLPAGHEPWVRVMLPLRARLSSAAGRTDYARVAVVDGGVEPLAVSGASVLSTATRADGFVVIPAAVEGHDEGDPVVVHLYG